MLHYGTLGVLVHLHPDTAKKSISKLTRYQEFLRRPRLTLNVCPLLLISDVRMDTPTNVVNIGLQSKPWRRELCQQVEAQSPDHGPASTPGNRYCPDVVGCIGSVQN